MTKHLLFSIGSLSVIALAPLCAQDFSKLAFNIGGGVSSPLNPMSQYTGLSANFSMGAGYNINKSNAIIGEFLWTDLPPNLFVLHPIDAPKGNLSLYTLTASYRHQIDRIHGSPFGVYGIAGGGWYYRYASVDKDYVVPPNTVCQPTYTWWGYGCDPSGYVYTKSVAFKGSSAPGVNAGVGFTIRLLDTNWKFYAEARYHYAWSNNVPTTLIPITFGIRFN